MIALGGPREAAHPAGAVGGEFPIFKIMYLAYLIPDTWYLMYNPLGYTRTMYLYFIIRIVLQLEELEVVLAHGYLHILQAADIF